MSRLLDQIWEEVRERHDDLRASPRRDADILLKQDSNTVSQFPTCQSATANPGTICDSSHTRVLFLSTTGRWTKVPSSAFCFQYSCCLPRCSFHCSMLNWRSAFSFSESITLCKKSGSMCPFSAGHSADSSSSMVPFCSPILICSITKPCMSCVQPGCGKVPCLEGNACGRVGTSGTASVQTLVAFHGDLHRLCDSPPWPALEERVLLAELSISVSLDAKVEHCLLRQKEVADGFSLFRLRGRTASKTK